MYKVRKDVKRQPYGVIAKLEQTLGAAHVEIN